MNKSDRREFLKYSSLAAAGLFALPSCGNPLSILQNERVRVGVIGSGSRGQGLMHLMNDIDGIELTACCDVLPFRLEEALGVAPKAKGYVQFEDLLDDPNVDAVIISTPFGLHDEVALAALDAKKHIYCEKTMVKGIAEIQSVVNKAEQTDVVFQTGYQYHSSPLYKKARSIIQSGYLGEITAYECQWNRNADWRRPVPDPKWERMVNWRMYKEHSGGMIAELMSHQLDFINWVTGELPSRIVGFGGIDHWKDGRETYDNIHLLMEYPNKIDASFTCTTTNSFGDYEIKVLGKKGTMILDYNSAEIYIESGEIKETGVVDGVSGATKKAWEEGKGAPIDAPGNDPTIDALKQFHSSIVDGSPIISTLQSGANSAKCVQIAFDAVHEGQIKYWKDYPELKFSTT